MYSLSKVTVLPATSLVAITVVLSDFKRVTFETAANKVFDSFSIMQPDAFLKEKNIESYNEFQKKTERDKSIKANNTESH